MSVAKFIPESPQKIGRCRRQLAQRFDIETCRGELNGERQAIHTTADLSNGTRTLTVE